MRTLNRVADRMLTMFVPKATAKAACSGSWTYCTSYYDGACTYEYIRNTKALWKCSYKANCTDTCSKIGCCA